MTAHLAGHSGAELTLLTRHGRTIVRKCSTAASSCRLKKQMEKQIEFASLKTPIRTPEILGSETTESGLFFFDMEYVPALDCHRFLEICGPAEFRRFEQSLSEHLASLPSLPPIASSSSFRSFFESCVFKLIEVHRRQVGLTDQAMGRIINALESVENLGINETGFCHGDFTLENILVDSRGSLVFVDFLDSAFEHPIQDFVKLSQDIHGGWFQIKGRRISAAFVNRLGNTLEKTSSTAITGYSFARNALLSLNFCRILPYARNRGERDQIVERIERFSL